MLDVYLRNGRAFLAVRLFLPKREKGIGVVYSHGWGGAHLFDDLHQYLADSGITVASLEQRGYGRSPGKAVLAKWPDDMAAVGEWLRARNRRVWSMGLSTGGTMALVTAGKHAWIGGAIALSPFATLKRIRQDYPPGRKVLADRFGAFRPIDYATADALTWTAKIAPRPAIVVHARGDEIVPFAHAEMIRDHAGATLWAIPRGDHRMQKTDRRALFRRILETLTKAG
ncbi:MAG TPA: alpha/beta hydrolase [Candidatus Methylomirabilis sp.]|nr:alpha/beta hydrolase [Candidatus Methylomirabilis sp.]